VFLLSLHFLETLMGFFGKPQPERSCHPMVARLSVIL
jgi:hypothetical protein